MYIAPFMAGVLVTIGAEILIIFLTALITSIRRMNEK